MSKTRVNTWRAHPIPPLSPEDYPFPPAASIPAASMSQRSAPTPPPKKAFGIPQFVYIISGWALAALAFLGDFSGYSTGVVAKSFRRDLCHSLIQPSAVLSRETLAQLLLVPERSPKAQIREVVADPYCQLADLEVRAGVIAQREAFPLAFDPQTWLILLYEGEEYAGYDFRVAQ